MSIDPKDRAFQQSLCESRSVYDNLDPASARLLNELQKQNTKLKSDLSAEKQKCRMMAKDHLVELKRLREEHERRLESSLEALNSRKDQEKAVELKRVEEQLIKQRENEVRFVNKGKNEEIKALERRLQRKADDHLRLSLERQRREIYEEVEAARIPDEQGMARKEAKLMKEIFDLGEENLKLEDQIRNLSNENRSQIDQLRKMKQEHKAEIEHILRQTKIDASRDMAKLKLAEQALQERDTDLMEICQRAEIAEQERGQLEAEVTVLKIVHENNSIEKANNDLKKSGNSTGNLAILRKVEDLEVSVKKLEEEKFNLKHENAALRKKLVQGNDTDTKGKKELEDEVKRLRKRHADMSSIIKTMDDRVEALKLENKRIREKHLNESTDVEQNLRKTLSRQHAKDISEYTRKIASRDREILNYKRRLSKYEVSSDARHEPASELDKKVRMMSMERIKMEKLMAKLYNAVPDPSDIELMYKEVCNDVNRLQELSEENARLRTELHELQKPSEVDGQGKPSTKNMSDLDVVRDLRDENQRLQTELQEMCGIAQEKERLDKALADSEMATYAARKRLTLLQEDLDQARMLSQEYERAREHCSELESEVADVRGQLNEKDREMFQKDLEKNAQLAVVQEKEEEVEMLKETVQSLKNELRQNEDLVRDLHKEVELASISPDTTHIGLQTSPLLTPKLQQQASQTSPLAVKHSNSFSDPKPHGVPKSTSLHNEFMDVGANLSDPFASESPSLVNGDSLSAEISEVSITGLDKPSTGLTTTSTTSLTESDQQLVSSRLLSESSHPKLVTNEDHEEPSLYIASDEYDPQLMSPNHDKEVELTIKKGDYVYVYGEEREDGFYVGRLVNGTKGLVPCSYIKKLTDQPFKETTPTRQLSSNTSVSSPSLPPPPINMELNRQYVDKDNTDCYCLWICWEHPVSIATPTADIKGYNVYVNGTFDSTVPAEAETSVSLSDIPRNQYTRVTVRTVDHHGNESIDPHKPVEINLQYPSPPVNVTLHESVSNNVPSYTLLWSQATPTSPRPDVPPVSSYKVYLNDRLCLMTTPTSELVSGQNGQVGVELVRSEVVLNGIMEEEDGNGLKGPYYLTVQSSNTLHDSPYSNQVPIPDRALYTIMPQLLSHDTTSHDTKSHDTTSHDEHNGDPTSSEVSMMSSSAAMSGRSTSYTEEESSSQSQLLDEGVDEVIVGNYYKAMYPYNPQLQSPNLDAYEEELAFEENDIIQAVGSLDEDGFFMGEKEGEKGLVPKNMVEHVDNEMSTTLIADMNHIDHHPASSSSSSSQLLEGEFKLVQALYDYNPFKQSQNPNPEEELAFKEGELIYVRRVPHEDGFYEGELRGQSGLVPMTFVKPVRTNDIINSISDKTPPISTSHDYSSSALSVSDS